MMLAVLLTVPLAVMVEFSTMALPAARVIFVPDKGPFRVRLSVVAPLAVAPAVRVMLPLVDVTPPAAMVRGL